MGKHANTAAAPVSKVAKKSIVATMPTPAHATVNQPDDKYAPVMDLLRQAHDIPESCFAMLQTVLPHCLGVCPDERHPYQSTMVAALEKVVRGVEEKHAAAIAAVEAQIADTEAEQSSNVSALESLAAGVAQLEGGVAGKAAELGEAAERAAAERAKLAAEEGERKSQEGSHAELLAGKVDFEDVHSELWKVVKAGTLQGKDWPKKKKMADATMAALRDAGMCASLAASLDVTLRGKLAERGPFAEKALEHGEQFFEKHIAEYTERILGAESKIAEQAQAVAAAGEGLAAAEKVVQERAQGLRSAQSSLDAARLEHEQAAAAAETGRSQLRGLQAALEKERASLAATQALASKFDALRQPAEAPAEAPACEGEAAAAPCPVDEEAAAAPCPMEGGPVATPCQ
mmetsp:Transcript_116062/g.328937  ORF Transcript_116062/g.328937 Transcript_116062/m.328937 type:complete len:402 (-) Transcript_116062:139-1344(-)